MSPEQSPQSIARVYEVAEPAGVTPSGEEMLAGLRDGRAEAYEALLDQFEAPLYRFFYFSHGDHDLAQDQCGDTFAQLVVAIHKMRGGPESLRAFVFGIARNILRRSWRAKHPRLATEATLSMLADQRPTAYLQAAQRQQIERVLEAIDQFSEPARQVMILRFIEELPIAEVAKALGLPVGTIKSYMGAHK